MKNDTIVIPRWFDRHLHARDGEMLSFVLTETLAQRATGAVLMPNLPVPLTTIERVRTYRMHVEDVVGFYDSDFVPCMTLYLTDDTEPAYVVEGFQKGVWSAVKLYLADQQGKGGTTGSAHGVRDLESRYRVFEAMEKHGIPLLGHFEAAEETVDEFDREIVSVKRDLIPILETFPALTVVFEHVTDHRTARMIAESDHDGLYATVTAHHMVLNRNDMFRGGMHSCNYCKPVPKREESRRMVRKYVTSGNMRFGAGTDSAPHLKLAKSYPWGSAAGIFTAPVAVELYTTIFEEEGALSRLGDFLSRNFLHVYGVEESIETMTLRREEQIIPRFVDDVPVFMGGTTIPWKLV